jgi:putative redox protein
VQVSIRGGSLHGEPPFSLDNSPSSMITTSSESTPYQTRFSNGTVEAIADVKEKDGGHSAGFGPHDLLEAALATCVNITVRMYADHHNIPLAGVTTKVGLTRPQPDEVLFYYEVAFEGDLTAEQKERLTNAAHSCPVRKTLSKKISFESATS